MLFEAFIELPFAPAGNMQKNYCKTNQSLFSGTL